MGLPASGALAGPYVTIRTITSAGWDLHVAAVGNGRARWARSVANSDPVTVVLTEGKPPGRSPERGTLLRPRTEVQLGRDGTVRARCDAAPPVLMVRAGAEPVRTLLGGWADVGPGGLLLAFTPSLLDALDPPEVVAAPRLLQLCPDPVSLLRRWLDSVAGSGAGASSVFARRRGPVTRCGPEVDAGRPALDLVTSLTARRHRSVR